MPFKTIITAKAHLLDPSSEKFKTVAAKVEKYGLVLQPQMDLMYVESCLVSAGNRVGINDNDDIFTSAETWAARCTPVLKPLNWQHNDKDIVGVMYSVQARDLNGNILDISGNTPPSTDFDLWTEAVFFKFIHANRADEIQARAQAGNLYVSMEAWFDDYHYGICNTDGVLNEIVNREKSTAFLDQHLRAYKGSGSYEGKRIGRVLKSITFGGCGLVDRPANKRSEISQFAETVATSEDTTTVVTEARTAATTDTTLIKWFSVINKEMNNMDAQANQDPKKVINEVLDEREDKRAKAEAQRVLQARANELEAANTKLEQQVVTLNESLQSKNQELESLSKQFTAFDEAIKSMVETVKGSTADDLVSRIDNAQYDPNSVFQAKLAFIKQTAASLAKANEVNEKSVLKIREQEVRAMFANELLPNDSVEALVAKAQKLTTEEAYEDWKVEKELFALELKAAKKMDKKDSGMKDLVSKKNQADMQIDHAQDVSSGVNPGQLRNPRFKIAGSAGDALADELETAHVNETANLAGAEAQDDGQENAVAQSFRALASLLIENDSDDESEKE